MHGVSRPALLIVLAVLAGVPSAVAQDPDPGPTTRAAAPQADPTIDELAFFTTDHIHDTPPEGCAVSVNILRLSDGQAVLRDIEGGSMLSTLRASAGLQVVIAGYRGLFGAVFDEPSRGAQGSHAGIQLPGDLQRTYGSIYVLRKDPSAASGWDVASTVVGRDFYLGIDILPDGDTLLVATMTHSPISFRMGPPFQVEAYSLAEMIPLAASPDRTATHRLGPVRGTVELADPVVGIVLDPGGTQAHLLTQGADANVFPPEDEARLVVHTIDVPSMREVEPPIELPPWVGTPLLLDLPMAAISPDGRHLITTRGGLPAINVVDLPERRAWSVPIDRARSIMDVSFSHGAANRGLLALNLARPPDPSEVLPPPMWHAVRSEVMIAALQDQALVELGRGPASPGRDEVCGEPAG